MIKICTICARGNSKGVLNKNIRPIDGFPLVAHSIVQARETELFDAISVSSDSDEILNIARTWGADFIIKRPETLALDTSAKIPAIKHCLLETEKLLGRKCAVLVDLDATSPLRDQSDIKGAIELLETSNADSVITGASSRRSPYFNMVELTQNNCVKLCKESNPPVVRRQDAPISYDMNASIYVWKREKFVESPSVFYPNTKLFVMPEERSFDIDTELDFEWVEYLFSRKGLS